MARSVQQQWSSSCSLIPPPPCPITILTPTTAACSCQVSVNVRILSEGCTSDVPLLMRQGFSSIHPALTRPWDLQLLVGSVRRQLELVLLPVGVVDENVPGATRTLDSSSCSVYACAVCVYEVYPQVGVGVLLVVVVVMSCHHHSSSSLLLLHYPCRRPPSRAAPWS